MSWDKNYWFKSIFYLWVFSLPLLAPDWHGKLLAVVTFFWLFSKKDIRLVLKPIYHNYATVLLTLFGISLIGILYSHNVQYSLSYLETIVPLLIVFVLVLSAKDLDSKKIIIAFVAGVIVLNLASLYLISYDLWDYEKLQANLVLANDNIAKIHPIFVSLYISFCFFFLLDQYFPLLGNDRSKLGWVLFSLIILVIYLVWLNSRAGILSFSIAFIFYSFYRFRSRGGIVALSLVTVIIIIIYSAPYSYKRFFNSAQQVMDNKTLIDSEDPNIYPLIARMQIFDCSVDLVNGTEFLYGYGTGDFRDVLRDCFRDKGYNSLYEKGLDSHNEYFAQMHRHGIVGLLLFVALLIVPFRYALKYRSPLLAVFIILFSITAIFENVFSAQKGVTFFALFCPLLMLYARKKCDPSPNSQEPV